MTSQNVTNTNQNSVSQPTMSDLLRKVGVENPLVVGQKVAGKVIFVVKNEVLIEIPNLGIGIVRGKELYSEDFLSHLKVGGDVEAIILSLDNELGVLELSFKAIGHDKVWTEINKAFEEKEIVEAKVRDLNRGGFMVRVKGIEGFLPASLLSPQHSIKQQPGNVEDKSMVNQMKKYLGQTFHVKIININTENENVIVSERAVSDEIIQAKLNKYKTGDVIDGIIAGAADFGLFVRFDDLEGLVHISEIAWKKVEDPRLEYKTGDPVRVKIIEIDKDNRINLSIKQTITNPWANFAKSVKPGDKFVGKIAKFVSYGLIIVDEVTDIQGLCHITQIKDPAPENIAIVQSELHAGEVKEFTILSIDAEEKLYLTMLNFELAAQIQEDLVARQKEQREEKAKLTIDDTENKY